MEKKQFMASTEWLEKHLNAPDLRVLDASLVLPGDPRDCRAEYEACHIPRARFFDINDIADSRSELPHMVPLVEKFISRMRAMGIGDGHRVVIYDTNDALFSAARAWWMFKLFGKNDVAILDGGLPKWLREGRPVEDTLPMLRDRHFTARRNAALVRDVTQVAASLKLADAQIVDARSPARFAGEAEELREGVRKGRIPGSKNVYYKDLTGPKGTLLPLDEIREIFDDAGIDLDKPIILTCGSGVTACVLAHALERLGHRQWSVYDGSWSEWGMYEELAIEAGW
ncbi:MAG: 3-mercaptopyruvate sulfurtransferase [Rhodobacteraceae bacterium]|nr:3-mercaptopyruvate sulfurtransferase [Paracoccaceae bacterium]